MYSKISKLFNGKWEWSIVANNDKVICNSYSDYSSRQNVRNSLRRFISRMGRSGMLCIEENILGQRVRTYWIERK